MADRLSIPQEVALAVMETVGVPTEDLGSADLQASGCIDEADFKETMKEMMFGERRASLFQRGVAMKLYHAAALEAKTSFGLLNASPPATLPVHMD